MKIRYETPDDYEKVENLVRDAFWNKYMPGCSEHLLIHKIRQSDIFKPELSFIVEEDGVILGAIYTVLGKLETVTGNTVDILSFGPLAVEPLHQKQVVGSFLMRHLITEAKKTEYPMVLIYGDKNYYVRFGFEEVSLYGIVGPDGGESEHLLVLPLNEAKMPLLKGSLRDEPLYHLEPEEIDAFDASFPPKRKEKLDGQLW